MADLLLARGAGTDSGRLYHSSRQRREGDVATTTHVGPRVHHATRGACHHHASHEPFCPGLTLETCPSPSADSLRQVIIARVTRGDTRAQIEADLERDFGSAVRSTPKMEGFGLVGWGVPAVMLLVGAWWVTRWIRRRVVSV